MFLRRIVLEDVRCIQNIEMSFLRGDGGVRKWTLLLSENGCGKSTILRAIALVLAGRQAIPGVLGDPSSWIRANAKLCRIVAELESPGERPREIELKIRRGDGVAEVLHNNEKTLGFLDDSLRRHPGAYFLVGYGASRCLGAGEAAKAFPSTPQINSRAEGMRTLFFPDAPLPSLSQWATQLHYRKGAEGLRIVRSALNALLPDTEFADIDRGRGELLFRTPDGRVPLSQLSDGYQSMAAWCGDLLYRVERAFGYRAKPLHAPGLLLIDEIDLHLHPAWQRNLRVYLENTLPNFQIIGSTHSLLTAQQADVGELQILERPKESTSPKLKSFPGAARSLMVHQILQPLFGVGTVDSREVESLKNEYRLLRDKRRRTQKETNRFRQLQDILRDLPDWAHGIRPDQQHSEVMSQLLTMLEQLRGQPRASRAREPVREKAKAKTRRRAAKGKQQSKASQE